MDNLTDMQFEDKNTTAKMLAKIRGLLAKAESTDFPEEADALTAKAQTLMSAYSIDEAVLRQDAVRSGSVKPNRRDVNIDKPYARQKAHLLNHIANANNSSAIWDMDLGLATVFGFDADLDLVELLYTSLLVQADAAMNCAGRQQSAWGTSSTRSYRSSFLYAFGVRIGRRLQEAKDEAVVSAGTGAGLVLASQNALVRQAVAQRYPDVRRSRASVSNMSGWAAGTQAANDADIGGRRKLKAG